MAGEYPFINAPGSGWHDTSPNSGTVARQIRSQTKERLLQEAQSLLPDSNALSEQLIKYKLSGGDRNVFVGQLNGMINEYLKEFNENPYYAFTKRGKDLSKKMQQWVNHPSLTSLEANQKRLEKEYERAERDGILGKINVVGGKISAYDTKNKRFTLVSPENIDYKRYQPLTVQDALDFQGKTGFFNQEDPYTPNDPLEISMASDKELRDHINAILTDTGDTTLDDTLAKLENVTGKMSDLATSRISSNSQQLSMKMNALMSAAGLSGNYWDTLKSNAYSALRDAKGAFPSEERVNQEAVNYLKNLIFSRSKYAENITPLPQHILKATGKGDGSEKDTNVGVVQGLLENQIGSVIDNITNVNPTNPRQMYTGRQVPLINVLGANNQLYGALPAPANAVLNSFVTQAGTITTQLGDVPLKDKRMIIPAKDGKFTIVPDGSKAWVIMDAYVPEDNFQEEAGANINAVEVDENDKGYIENLLSIMNKESETNPLMHFPDTGGFMGKDYVKVAIKFEYDPNLNDMFRVATDKNPLYMPREGANLFGTKKQKEQADPNLQRNIYQEE
jgi:hypothetical protein